MAYFPVDYKVPWVSDTGVKVAQEVNGSIIYYFNGHVAELQELLCQSYNSLSYTYSKFRRVQYWLNQAGDNRDTSMMENERAHWRKVMRTDREKTVNIMTLLLRALEELKARRQRLCPSGSPPSGH